MSRLTWLQALALEFRKHDSFSEPRADIQNASIRMLHRPCEPNCSRAASEWPSRPVPSRPAVFLAGDLQIVRMHVQGARVGFVFHRRLQLPVIPLHPLLRQCSRSVLVCNFASPSQSAVFLSLPRVLQFYVGGKCNDKLNGKKNAIDKTSSAGSLHQRSLQVWLGADCCMHAKEQHYQP